MNKAKNLNPIRIILKARPLMNLQASKVREPLHSWCTLMMFMTVVRQSSQKSLRQLSLNKGWRSFGII